MLLSHQPKSPPLFYAARTAELCGVVALLQRAGVEERHLVSVARKVMRLEAA